MKTVLLAIALTLIIAVACGEDDEGGPVLQRTPDGQAMVSLSADEIAATLEDFSEAFGNGDTDALATYWSQTCTEEQIRQSASDSMSAKSLLDRQPGGEFEVTVDADALVIDVEDSDHVTIPVKQSEDVVVVTVAGRTLQSDEAPVSGVPFSLVREKGVWKVATCTISIIEDEEDEEIGEGAGP